MPGPIMFSIADVHEQLSFLYVYIFNSNLLMYVVRQNVCFKADFVQHVQ